MLQIDPMKRATIEDIKWVQHKGKGIISPMHCVRHAGGWSYSTTHSYTWPLAEVSGQFHIIAALPLAEKTLSKHWIEGWVNLRASVDTLEKFQKSKHDSLVVQPAHNLAAILAVLSLFAILFFVLPDII